MDEVKKADKKLSSRWSFGDKFNDALSLYSKAIVKFQQEKDWVNLYETLAKRAQLHLNMESPCESAADYDRAASYALKAEKNDKAIYYWDLCHLTYVNDGKFRQAGRACMKIFKHYGKLADAEAEYKWIHTALHCYSIEEDDGAMRTCYERLADLHTLFWLKDIKPLGEVETNQLALARQTYQCLVDACRDLKLMRYAVISYQFNSALCILAADDLTGFKRYLEQCTAENTLYSISLEAKLLGFLTTAYEERDADAFRGSVKWFNEIKTLSGLQIELLLKIVRSIDGPKEESLI